MFGAAITIMLGAVLVWTMPAGAEKDGAMAVIGVLGMGFNLIGLIWFTGFLVRNRKTVREMFHDFINE